MTGPAAPARVFDALAAAVLLALVAPVLLLAMLAVLVLDGAPIFFRQPRLGLGRAPFRILKLRTMTGGRVSVLGGWLRDLGLDELPQLVNVLRGEMALVGPRPLTGADVARLGWQGRACDARWSVRPGLTGLAQVAPVRRCHPRTTFRLDLRYVRARSLRGDLGILAASAVVPLLGKRRARRALRRWAWGRA